MNLEKMFARWSAPDRPLLLPNNQRMVARLSEIKEVKLWRLENVQILIDIATEIHEKKNDWRLYQLIQMVELGHWTWGVDNDICMRLVDRCIAVYF